MAYFKDRVRALKELYAQQAAELTLEEKSRAMRLWAQHMDSLPGMISGQSKPLSEDELEWLDQALQRLGAGRYEPPPLPYKEPPPSV